MQKRHNDKCVSSGNQNDFFFIYELCINTKKLLKRLQQKQKTENC